jgi:hypothetical protein
LAIGSLLESGRLDFLEVQQLRELLKKTAVTVPKVAFCTKNRLTMKEMSEKPMYRILHLVSLLALTYYAASSINYIVESHTQTYSYDSQLESNWSTAQLETRRSGK